MSVLFSAYKNHWKKRTFIFFAEVIGLVCRTVTIFLPMQRARLSGPPRYLERCRKAYRKFSRGTWKKSFSSKYEILKNEVQSQVRIFWQNLIFWAETFFQMPLEIFLWALRQRSRYLGGPLNIALCNGKKIMTVRHTNPIILQKMSWRGKNHAFFSPPCSRYQVICTTWEAFWLILKKWVWCVDFERFSFF